MHAAIRVGLLPALLMWFTQACGVAPRRDTAKSMSEVKLVIVEPGHFHAALVQKDMYPQVSPRVSVYAPLGPELLDYVNRVSLFNLRADNPTKWELDIHTGPKFFERMLGERPGNVVVFAGRNREKIGRIVQSLNAGYNVLADKPWIIASTDLPRLASALDLAERNGLVGYDIMTERYEITSILQKELVNAPDVFGQLEPGSATEPAVTARSIHHLMKVVAEVPLRRPAWFFDIEESGEGIADVGTHVVDLVQWTAFPAEHVDYRADIQMLGARRWPTIINRTQFTQVTGETDFPAHLAKWVKGGQLEYYCNNSVHYTVRGAHVQLDILWNWEALGAAMRNVIRRSGCTSGDATRGGAAALPAAGCAAAAARRPGPRQTPQRSMGKPTLSYWLLAGAARLPHNQPTAQQDVARGHVRSR